MLLTANFAKSEKIASDLLTTFNIETAPVPVFDIVVQLGIDLIEYNLGTETSGVLVVKKDKGTIGYNPKDSMVRRRFTIAHELGHYLQHKDTNELFVDSYFLLKYRANSNYSDQDYIHEQEANAFAAAFLMPEKMIRKFLQTEEFKGLTESELIAKLAAKFEVSVTAMTFRLTNLYINPG